MEPVFSSLSIHDPSLIFGDFNSHHTSWNSNIDTNGIKLLNSINDSDLILVNQNTLTYINFNQNSLSNIDLVLFSPAIYDLIKFNILDHSWRSDHFPIIANLLVDKTPYIQKQWGFTSKKKLDPMSYLDEKITFKISRPSFDSLDTIGKYNFFFKCYNGSYFKLYLHRLYCTFQTFSENC